MNTNQTRSQVRNAVFDLPKMLAGASSDRTGLVNDLLYDLGHKALTLIHEAFQAKSKGGSDLAGITWPRQTKRYVAYGRDHGRPTKKVGERPRGLLTDAQDAQWRAIFAVKARHFTAQGDPDPEGSAASIAWAILKSQGARTMLEDFGNQQVDILHKSGDLEASLTPDSGHPDQLFEVDVSTGKVAVGSKLPYAAAHHFGNPAKNLPERKLWPEPDNLPQEWQEAFGAIILEAVAKMVAEVAA